MIFNPVVQGGGSTAEIATISILQSGRDSWNITFIDSDGSEHANETSGTFTAIARLVV